MNKLSLAEFKPSQHSPVQFKFEFDRVRLGWFSKMYIFLRTENQNPCQVSVDAENFNSTFENLSVALD